MREDQLDDGRVETGIEEAAAYQADLARQATVSDRLATSGTDRLEGSNQANGSRSSSAALDFLDDFFGAERRHLVAIKKGAGKSEIKARHFDAADHAGQLAFVIESQNAGFDLYFTPNPVKGTLHRKASKNDIVEVRHLWVDLDPRKNQPLEAERAARQTGAGRRQQK